MKKKFTQYEILEMMKTGWSLFKSRSVGSYAGHWYMKKGEDYNNVSAIPINALIRHDKIALSLKIRKWSDPKEYVIKN